MTAPEKETPDATSEPIENPIDYFQKRGEKDSPTSDSEAQPPG